MSVVPEAAGMFERAMGAGVRIARALLTASGETARKRRVGRELGSELEQELEGNVRKARVLDQRAPAEAVRVATDGRLVVDTAREAAAATGWAGPHFARRS
ncbi:hypothetical protein GCM10009527_087940 [Actinomadura nitritigenes]